MSVIFIDPAQGSDDNGMGTKDKPYASVRRGLDDKQLRTGRAELLIKSHVDLAKHRPIDFGRYSYPGPGEIDDDAPMGFSFALHG